MNMRKTVSGVGVAALFAAAFVTGTAQTAAAAPACEDLVSAPGAEAGWTSLDGTAPTYVKSPLGGVGEGALDYTVSDNKGIVEYYHPADQQKIADVTGTSIGYKETKGTTGSSYQLRITGAEYDGADNGAGSNEGFATLVWVPSNNKEAGTVADGWTTYSDLENGNWWSTRTLTNGIKRGQPITLKEFADKQPKAVLDHYGVNLGSGAAAGTNHVDAIKFGCATDFELEAPPAANGSLGDLFKFGS